MTVSPTSAPAFEAWLADFFDAYYRHNPVNATFVGVHAHDARLPDPSAEGRAAQQAERQRLLARLNQLPDEPLTTAQRIDRTLVQGHLEIAMWEGASPHFAHANPSTYT